MLYYLFRFLEQEFNLTGASLFQYISFRGIAAAMLSLLIGVVFGKKIIRLLQRQQIGETIRELDLQGQNLKAGTPTMGGIIILAATLIPTLLLARLDNIYIILLLITTFWLGLIGFVDDYIKVIKKDKGGLQGKFKIVGQIGIGILIGVAMYYHPDVLVREFTTSLSAADNYKEFISSEFKDIKSLTTTIPFFKENELDYHMFVPEFLGEIGVVVFYILLVTFIITAVSNGANLTDGLDGLAAGSSAIIAVALSAFAYVSGNIILADYLNIMYLPNTGEVVIFCMAFIGACIGFLWYNSFPAQVFMGDTGSLSIGGIIAVLAITLRKELMIPVLCGVFLVENLSVVLQVSYFKYTKKKFGEGRRIFLMSPLHHHYQKKGYHEVKIVTRFWIVGILLVIFALATLKIR